MRKNYQNQDNLSMEAGYPAVGLHILWTNHQKNHIS